MMESKTSSGLEIAWRFHMIHWMTTAHFRLVFPLHELESTEVLGKYKPKVRQLQALANEVAEVVKDVTKEQGLDTTNAEFLGEAPNPGQLLLDRKLALKERLRLQDRGIIVQPQCVALLVELRTAWQMLVFVLCMLICICYRHIK
jgi:hypothetical protein